MQVNSPSHIEVVFRDEHKFQLRVLQNPHVCRYDQVTSIKQYINLFGKPTAFIWHDSHLRPITPKLIKWIEEEFKPLFDYDPLKWLASVGTCFPELRPYLKDFHDISSNL
jgi:hypothetical protein